MRWYWVYWPDHMPSELPLREDKRLVLSMHSRRIFGHLGLKDVDYV